jgi:predicted  nucleic acid-binding Zn-ribbon protein
MPVASANRGVELDWRVPYEALLEGFAGGDRGVGSAGAALALWRAATDAGFRAWCYEFGFPDSYVHGVTVIEADGDLEVHDAFLNQSYRAGLFDILDGLRDDRLPTVRRETRDRKIYLVDPVSEPRQTIDWLVVHADRELEPVGSLRRFEVQWDEGAFVATHPDLDRVYRALEEHGHSAELAYLMLHPVSVFDGVADHRDRPTMPLVGGRDLRSPSAALHAGLRRLTRELAEERQQAAERAAAAHQLEAELVETRGRLAAAGAETAGLSAQLAELCHSLSSEAECRALESELGAAKAATAAAERKACELERQIAELRGEWHRRAAAWQDQRQSLTAAIAASDQAKRRLQAEAQAAGQDLSDARAQLAAAHNLAVRRAEEWRVERKSTETVCAQAVQDAVRAHSELIRAETQLTAARALVGDWREAFARGTRDWASERRSLTAASEAFADNYSRLTADFAQAREDAATAREELAAARAALAGVTAEREAERARFDTAQRKQSGRWRGLGGVLRVLFARPPADEPTLSHARSRTM